MSGVDPHPEPGDDRPAEPTFDATLGRLDDLVDDGRIVHVEHLPPRLPSFGELARPLPQRLRSAIPERGLWTHQATMIDRLRAGEDTVIATGTASGKSLAYQLPIAEAVIDPVHPSTALCIYPTKALAHDQLRALGELDVEDLRAATYDGDATPDQRSWARSNADVILTNPEMVHGAVLPHHKKWSEFLMRLRFVVVDELHVLRGIFGSHVAHVLRRLLRVCHHYGANPTFAFTSATIGTPGQLASSLLGRPVGEVVLDGSPKGERRFALLNPPIVDETSGMRTSANSETAAITARLLSSGQRTITFCRSRKGTELVAADIDRRLGDDLTGAVRPYRSGYLAEERRSIEEELATGSARGVVATSALELGVDIGGLDACVMNGFPGTIASMWQQAGRAGRDHGSVTTVLVAGEDQLDQWLMAHPTELFARPPEPAVINPTNPFILEPHLAAAAFELPLTHADERYWSDDDLHDGVRELSRRELLRVNRRGRRVSAYWTGRGFPARDISLRSGSTREVKIFDEHDQLVGTVDSSRAPSALHSGAVYLHRGRSYEVTDLDLDACVAEVRDHDGTTYTQARSDTSISVLAVDERIALGSTSLVLGSVEVANQVTGYQVKDTRSREVLASEPLDLPPSALITRSFWYEIPEPVVAAASLDRDRLPGSLHAAEHAMIGLLPLFAICDRWDVGGVSIAHHPDTGSPTVFIHEAFLGGSGIAELGFDASGEHIEATIALLESCRCDAGCPSCVQSPKCGNGNEPLDKAGALALLRRIAEGV